MKVLMPILHYHPVIGGLENWTQNIAERLADRAEIFVVAGRVKDQPAKEVRGGVNISRTSFFSLGDLSHSSSIYILTALPFIFFRSLSLIKKEKIGLLHCQGFLSSFLGFWLSRIRGIPYVATIQRLEPRRNPLKNFIYRKAVLCIAASQAISAYFEEIGCPNIEVIPNGIDPKRFDHLERKPHDGFVIMTVARLERVKGVEYLIRAISSLSSTIPNLRLLIIGDGSERKNLESLAGSLNLEERVGFLGEIPNEKIPEYLAGADCFVLPSIKEGFGIALLEAQAAGVAVIGTRVGGILDLVEDGKTGLLVEPRSPQQIAEAISKIYAGLRFPKINLEKYDWQNIAEKVYQLYQKVI